MQPESWQPHEVALQGLHTFLLSFFPLILGLSPRSMEPLMAFSASSASWP